MEVMLDLKQTHWIDRILNTTVAVLANIIKLKKQNPWHLTHQNQQN